MTQSSDPDFPSLRSVECGHRRFQRENAAATTWPGGQCNTLIRQPDERIARESRGFSGIHRFCVRMSKRILTASKPARIDCCAKSVRDNAITAPGPSNNARRLHPRRVGLVPPNEVARQSPRTTQLLWTNMETELVAEMIRSNPQMQGLIRETSGGRRN